MRTLSFAPLALFCLCGVPAKADKPNRRWYLGAAVTGKSDGENGSRYANPLTNELMYLPVAAELGYAVSPFLWLHASVGLGPLVGNETIGLTTEFLVGPEGVFRTGRTEFGLRLDGGYSHLSYDWRYEPASLHAFVLEPKGILRFRWSPLWTTGAQVGLRWKWILENSDASHQSGRVVGVFLSRHF